MRFPRATRILFLAMRCRGHANVPRLVHSALDKGKTDTRREGGLLRKLALDAALLPAAGPGESN